MPLPDDASVGQLDRGAAAVRRAQHEPDVVAGLGAQLLAVGGTRTTELEVVDSDKSRNAILALVPSAVSNEKAAAMFREFVTAALLTAAARLTSHSDAHLRASLIAAQLVGIAVLRHVIRVEPIAKASPDEIATLVAPSSGITCDRRHRRSGAGRRGFHVEAGDGPVQPAGEPPVGLTEQLHDRGDQDYADQGGVDEDGDG
jgi:hypothetical protein